MPAVHRPYRTRGPAKRRAIGSAGFAANSAQASERIASERNIDKDAERRRDPADARGQACTCPNLHSGQGECRGRAGKCIEACATLSRTAAPGYTDLDRSSSEAVLVLRPWDVPGPGG